MRSISEWKLTQVLFGQVLEEISSLFSSRSARFMPIKGAYLLLSDLAPALSERKMADIDLLLPEEEFDSTCTWFATLDNVSEAPNYWNFERSFLYTVGKNTSVYIEFHRIINFPARFILPPEELFRRAVKTNGPCVFPDATDALLIHVCHMLPHVVDGFSSQAMAEISSISSLQGFSWKEFWQRAATTGIFSFIWLVISTYRLDSSEQQTLQIPAVRSLYTRMLLRTGLFISLKNRAMRKILFELPFVRKPWWLLRYKLNIKGRSLREKSSNSL